MKVAAVLVVLGALLGGCAYQPPAILASDAPGFLWGLLHGFIAPFALAGRLIGMGIVAIAPAVLHPPFDVLANVRIYAYPNTGPFYDLGFLLGLTPWGGGAAASKS